MNILQTADAFAENAKRPGLLGLAGGVLEKKAQRELRSYFLGLGKDIVALKLEELYTDEPLTERQEDLLRAQVKHRMHLPLMRHRPLLLASLKQNMEAAHKLASKLDYAQEAEGDDDSDPNDPGVDKLGQSGKDAATFAADNAANLIQGIDETTSDLIADAVAKGISERLGVPGISSLIRDAVEWMTKQRADMIASTEMNRAMSDAALGKMGDGNIEYKQLVLAPDACEICQDNADEDPIPVDDEYPSGDLGPPFHPNCRCAVTGARAPVADEEED